MNYCTSYYQSEATRQKIHELRFSTKALNDALGYAERHSDQRVIVEILDLHETHLPNISKLHKIHEEMPNIFYDFYDLSDLVEYAKHFNRTVNYIMYHQPALTWGLVQILLYYNVSDITLGEPLVFDLIEIQKNIKSHGVKIRVRPNFAKPPLAREVGTDKGIHHFWILPQHLHMYENYIDVIDLLDNNIVRETAIVNAYTCGQPYEGRLDTLIEGVECGIGATFIDDKFVQRRLTCGQNCLKNSNYCHHCDQYVKMYEVIAAQRKSSN